MNLEEVTMQDCIEMYARRGKSAIVNDGKLLGFMDVDEEEERRNASKYYKDYLV